VRQKQNRRRIRRLRTIGQAIEKTTVHAGETEMKPT
jgi:hypothetical protein